MKGAAAGAGKGKKPRRARRTTPPPRERSPERWPARLRKAADGLLHLRAPDEPAWRWFWPVLALAFAARATVAISGDFVTHPDEIMQYLEQGHRLAFGNGVLYWEFFYGARSWLVPGLVAGILILFDALGLDDPAWYVDGVKLAFCALSLAVPAGMYFFARRHFDEAAARAALLAGAFWYELVGFAHKPMTEFVATGLAMALLASCARGPLENGPAAAWLAAFLAVLTAAIRVQYAPLAVALFGLFFLRCGKAARAHAAAAALAFLAAVGIFDAMSWGGGAFHSYRANLEFNLAIDRPAAWPGHQYALWLLYTGGGVSVLCMAAALLDLRRYGFLLVLVAMVLVVHSLEPHKEYRFVFAVVPLWLLVGAGVAARLAGRPAGRKAGAAWIYGTAGAVFTAASLAGILNALPRQDDGLSAGLAIPIQFVRGQDPVFAAWRHLAAAPGVAAVWQVDRFYHDLPGYYYLHRKIPLYDRLTGPANGLHTDLERLHGSVSHLVSGDPDLAVPGYAVEKDFGGLRVLRREENEAPVRGWRGFTPTVTHTYGEALMRRLYPGAPPPPANFGIRFAEPK